jgi:hypothetical protein
MKTIPPLILVAGMLSISGCDCWQCSEGIVRDAITNKPLDRVLVTSFTKGEFTEEMVTDTSGRYEVCTWNTGHCDDFLSITFKKEGYKDLEFADPPAELNVEMGK